MKEREKCYMSNFEGPMIIGMIGIQLIFIFASSVLKRDEGDDSTSGNLKAFFRLGLFLFALWFSIVPMTLIQELQISNSASADIISLTDTAYKSLLTFLILITAIAFLWFMVHAIKILYISTFHSEGLNDDEENTNL